MVMDGVQAAIVGTGYGSVELIRLLTRHPRVKEIRVFTHSREGEALEEIYPHLEGILDVTLEPFAPERVTDAGDVVFFGTPAGVSGALAPSLLEAGLRVIDLSGDFRLRDGARYETWYGRPSAPKRWLDQAVYGLAEIARDEVRKARLVANPGCYPTAALLALYPLVQAQAVDLDTLVLDGKSGVSGAGRGVSLGVHFSEVNENVKAYKVGVHQHIPEIEQAVEGWAGRPVSLVFVPHLVPMTRGILMTVYARWIGGAVPDTEGLLELYRRQYADAPFIRVLPAGRQPATKGVYGTNFVDLGVAFDGRTKTVIVTAAIDNLVKGAAGQAVQNMNVMFGWAETLGLLDVPLFP
ncbi:MAG: N-acetyl-gamma-glutamyl-phosphate reductase [Hydrogenibacillus sp.]|nr:N-acetyl-gamma-glutamyl-phosphate reductase [Hydrogenibacillus sp.]